MSGSKKWVGSSRSKEQRSLPVSLAREVPPRDSEIRKIQRNTKMIRNTILRSCIQKQGQKLLYNRHFFLLHDCNQEYILALHFLDV